MLDIHQDPEQFVGTTTSGHGVVSAIGAIAHIPKAYFLCLREGKHYLRMHSAPLMLTDLETHPIHRYLEPSEICLKSEDGSKVQ